MPRLIADLDAADYLAWKVREEMLSGGHIELPSEKELAERFRKIILARPIAAPKPPAEWMRTLAKELIITFVDANQVNYYMAGVESVIAKHYTAPAEGWQIPEKKKLPCECYIEGEYPMGCECGNYDDAHSQGYAQGWNACIDALAAAPKPDDKQLEPIT